MAIHLKLQSCLSLFADLVKCARNGHFATAISDQQGRLRVWGKTVRITGNYSLDKQLQWSSSVRDMVLELLEDLLIELEDCKIQIITPSPTGLFGPDTRSTLVSPLNAGAAVTPPLDGLQDVEDIIDDLYGMASTLKNPAPHDQIMDEVQDEVPIFPEQFDIQRVEDKYPDADRDLTMLLGKTNARRRGLLQYSRLKAEKLKAKAEEEQEKIERLLKEQLEAAERARRDIKSTIGSKNENSIPSSMKPSTKSSVMPSTNVTTVTTLLSSIFDEMLPTSQKNLENETISEDSDESIISETSYAATMNAKDDDARLRVPRPPLAFYEETAFECPYCFERLEHIRTEKAWKRHVFEDLQPYICTFQKCPLGGRTFARRAEWFHHETKIHRQFWVCSDGCNKRFTSRDLFNVHMRQAHRDTFADVQIEGIGDLCQRSYNAQDTVDCPLCAEKYQFDMNFRRHLGGELEELALFALPKGQGLDNDPDSSDGDDGYNTSNDEEVNVALTSDPKAPNSHPFFNPFALSRSKDDMKEIFHTQPPSTKNHALEEYQVQLMLLEKKNDWRLLCLQVLPDLETRIGPPEQFDILLKFNPRAATAYFSVAVITGRFDLIELLLATGLDINSTSLGADALRASIQVKNPSALEFLIGHNVDTTTIPFFTHQILRVVAAQGYWTFLERLLKDSSDDDVQYNSLLALHVAAGNGQMEVLKNLLATKIHLDMSLSQLRPTYPPSQWKLNRHLNYLDDVFSVEETTLLGSEIIPGTALQIAVAASKELAVEKLLAAGANVNTKTRHFDKTALEIAASLGNVKIMTDLLNAGAHIQGELSDAIIAGNQVAVGTLLLAGADLRSAFEGNRTLCNMDAARAAVPKALMTAVTQGYFRLAKNLLAAGLEADMFSFSKRGQKIILKRSEKAWFCIRRSTLCKACTNEKSYSKASYAASHLRRIHYKGLPKPPMSELRRDIWLDESEVLDVKIPNLYGEASDVEQSTSRLEGSDTSSYWSTPEQADFINLVAYYGTDWQKIANTLGTKNYEMVKNYYNCLVDSGTFDIRKMAQNVDKNNKRNGLSHVPPQATLVQSQCLDISSKSIASQEELDKTASFIPEGSDVLDEERYETSKNIIGSQRV